MTTDLLLVPLQHVLSVLPWPYQSLKNLRGSDREIDHKKVAWISKAENGRLLACIPELKLLLLVLGHVNSAYNLDVRVEQIDMYGARFASRGLLCSFGVPECRGRTCGRCQARFLRYKATHTLDPM